MKHIGISRSKPVFSQPELERFQTFVTGGAPDRLRRLEAFASSTEIHRA